MVSLFDCMEMSISQILTCKLLQVRRSRGYNALIVIKISLFETDIASVSALIYVFGFQLTVFKLYSYVWVIQYALSTVYEAGARSTPSPRNNSLRPRTAHFVYHIQDMQLSRKSLFSVDLRK